MIECNWQWKKKKEKSEKLEGDEEFQLRTTQGKILPERGGIVDFQTQAGKKLPKSVFAPLISANTTCTELYCIAFGGFIPEGCMSIEHAYPHKKIRENQVRLLNYLNDKQHQVIADSFLGYPGIADYIKRDLDGQIKGSLYFFKHSYGAMTNLYLLGQGENSSKGAKNLFDWIEQEENPPFKKELDKELGEKDKKLWRIGADTEKRLKEIIEKITWIEQALPEIQTDFQTLQERENDLRAAIKSNEKTVNDCLDELLALQANKGKLEEREKNLIKEKKELEIEKEKLENTLSQLDLPTSPHSEAETKSSPESMSAPMQVEPPLLSSPPHPTESISSSPPLSTHPDAFMSIKKHKLDKTTGSDMMPHSPPTKKPK